MRRLDRGVLFVFEHVDVVDLDRRVGVELDRRGELPVPLRRLDGGVGVERGRPVGGGRRVGGHGECYSE